MSNLNTTLCIGSIEVCAEEYYEVCGFKYNTLYRFNCGIKDQNGDIIANLNTTLCIGSI